MDSSVTLLPPVVAIVVAVATRKSTLAIGTGIITGLMLLALAGDGQLGTGVNQVIGTLFSIST